MKDIIKVMVIVTIILSVLLGGYLFVRHTINTHTNVAIAPNTSAYDYVIVEISSGMNSTDVIDILYEEELIRNDIIADWIARNHNWNAIQVGEYRIHTGMSLAQMFSMFIEGKTTQGGLIYVIIPEGVEIGEIANRMAMALELDAYDLMDLWSNKEFLDELIEEFWFLTDEILNPDILFPLEGYFYPIRHEIQADFEDAREVTFTMLRMTQHRLEGVRSQIEDHELTFHELIAFAAIIEAETQDLSEMDMVAGVFNNRMIDGWPLQTDATSQYLAYERTFHVTYAMNEVDSPFNTYVHLGLPPGPINSPSINAIIAAMNPAQHPYFFFLSDMFGCIDHGKHYTTTYEEHRALLLEILQPSYDAGYSLCDPNVQVN